MNPSSPRPHTAPRTASQASDGASHAAAQATKLLDLAGELLCAIFARAQADTDDAHRQAYGVVHAPNPPMPLLCRQMRLQFGATRKGGPRVMLVPLVLRDGTTPIFADGARWSTYLRAVPPAGNLRLISPAPTYDVDAHLQALGVRPDAPSPLFEQVDRYTIESATNRPHIRHVSCMWSFVQCTTALRQLGMASRVTAIDLCLSLPTSLFCEELDHRRRNPEHYVTFQMSQAVTDFLRDAPRLQSVSVRVCGLFVDEQADHTHALLRVRDAQFWHAWMPFAHGIGMRTTPLERLRFDVDPVLLRSNGITFDDYILQFVYEACTPYNHQRLHMFFRRHLRTGTVWRVQDAIPLRTKDAPPLMVRQVQLMHVGLWPEAIMPAVLAQLRVERFELLGSVKAFAP